MNKRNIETLMRLVDNPNVSATELRVLLYVATRGTNDVYSIDEASAAIGTSRWTWMRTVDSLIKKGLVEKSKKGVGKSSSYSLKLLVAKLHCLSSKIALTISSKNALPSSAIPTDNERLNYIQKGSEMCAGATKLKEKQEQEKEQENKEKVTQRENKEKDKEKEKKEKNKQNINAREHESETNQLVEQILNGAWAEGMRKTHNISIASLQWLVNQAVVYLYTSDEPVTETTIKRAAMSGAIMYKAEVRKRERIASLKAVPLSERRGMFRSEIAPLVGKYGRDMCNRFYRYWTETDEEGIMRYELCTAWDTANRLANFREYAP